MGKTAFNMDEKHFLPVQLKKFCHRAVIHGHHFAVPCTCAFREKPYVVSLFKSPLDATHHGNVASTLLLRYCGTPVAYYFVKESCFEKIGSGHPPDMPWHYCGYHYRVKNANVV